MGRPGDPREGARQRLARRKQKAREMHAAGASFRAIARELACSVSTVHAYINEPKRPGPPAPPAGNQRAATHSVYSQPVIGELQAEYRAKAARIWPHLSADDVEMWSRLAARVEQAAAHESLAGALAAGGDRVHSVSAQLVQWESRLRV